MQCSSTSDSQLVGWMSTNAKPRNTRRIKEMVRLRISIVISKNQNNTTTDLGIGHEHNHTKYLEDK